MKNLLLTVILLCFCLPFVKAADQKMILISTNETDLILQVAPNGRLYQTYLGNKLVNESEFENLSWNIQAGTDGSVSTRGWEVYPCSGAEDYFEPAFAIQHNDGNMTSIFKYVSSESKKLDNNVTETIISLKDDVYPVEAKLHYVTFAKENVIKAWTEIRHMEKKPVTITQYASNMLYFESPRYVLTEFSGDWAKEVQMSSQDLKFGKKIIDTKLGSRAAMHAYPFFEIGLGAPASENTGDVLMGTIGWTGNYRFTFEVDNAGNLRVISGINPYASAYELKPNEWFVTPEFIFTLSNQGTGKASRDIHDWARNYQIKDGKGDRLTLLNNWESTGFNFNEKKLEELMKEAKHLGVDMFLLDDGWFANKYPRQNDKAGLGDWEVTHDKLPNGIPHLVQVAKDAGVKFGIWIEPEMVNPRSELAEKHPDWIVKAGNREIPRMRNQWLLDLSNPKVQDFVFSVFDNTMKLSPNIDYIKWDANRHVENAGSEYLPEDKQSHFWIDYTQGFYKVMERIRVKYPDVLIQACASGGGRVEFGAMKYFNEVWTSDNTEALSRTRIQYGTSLFYPATVMGSHVSATPNHQTGNITPIKFRFDIACAGRLGMELQPKRMDDAEKRFARKAVASYKAYRDIVMEGDLYRIGTPYDDTGYYGMMYVSKDKKKAVLFTYCIRYQSRTLIPKFRLHGLDAKTRYTVREQNTDKKRFWFDGGTFTGEYLANAGINPNLNKIYDSAVFVLEAQ